MAGGVWRLGPERLYDELVPQLARQGLRTARFGLLGWSMGGYRALLLASQHPTRVIGSHGVT